MPAPSVPPGGRRVGADALALAVVVAAGVVLRFVTTSHLWLDEALSVNIASLPIGDIPDALRHDGHPPLYYLVLHIWMNVVGDGDVAVRALSGVFGVATLPLAWLAGRRLAGRVGASATLALLALSPFALRYATEARMYALAMLLVAAGWLLVMRALEVPSIGRLVPVAIVSGLLLLTHYWALWLEAAVVFTLVGRYWWLRRRAGSGPPSPQLVRVAVAVIAGSVLLIPWLPGLAYQAAHTGTPWGTPVRPAPILSQTLEHFGGGPRGETVLLGIALLGLFGLGLFGRAIDARRIQLDLATAPGARGEAAVVGLTVAVGFIASWATGATYAPRYAAVFFPLFLLVAALGLTRFVSRKARNAVVGVVLLLGAIGGALNVHDDRTQAGVVAAAIRARAAAGDLVVYCPDQLGPAVNRLLPATLDQVTYPRLEPPERVDWVDYDERNRLADPEQFIAEVLDRASPEAAIWVVMAAGYRTLEGQCEQVVALLSAARPGVEQVVVEDGARYFEHAGLFRAPPASPAS